jgi:hypothetical protein
MAKRNAPPRGFVVYDGPSLLTGERIVAIATLHSTNRKTGDMIQTWILVADIDPIGANRIGADISNCGNCAARGIPQPEALSGMATARSCYVDLGRAPMGIWNAWRRGIYPAAVGHAAVAKIGRKRKVRLGAYGDPAAVPSYVWESLISECDGHTAYSHQSDWQGSGFDGGLMMVSADQLPQAERAWSMGLRTFRVVGSVEELVKGREVLCPASEEAGHRTQCARCLLCGGAQVVAKSIAIVAHGAGRKYHRAA